MAPILILMLFMKTALCHVYDVVQTEMFAIPISPNLFNWTYQEFDQQYRFHASLVGKPELPSWMRYIYSGRHHSGFIFGTPPRKSQSPLTLEVIGLNRQDYETRRVLLTLKVHPKDNMATHEVELKIDNLNVEDLLDEHRMTGLKDILRTKLWTESSSDLYATFLSSAIDLGARLPLKPSDGEGLVVRLGSTSPFSTELKRLREEVRPLSRLPSCPRDYKRTTVERLFRDAGLTLDWCSFELYNTIYKERTTERLEYLAELPNASNPAKMKVSDNIWASWNRDALPSRRYAQQLTAALAAPLALLLLCVAALTAVLCFHYAAVAHKSAKVELCRYGTSNTEQTQVADNTVDSLGPSPNNSLARPYSPKSSTNLAGDYNRPQPPPYTGSNTNSLHHRRSTKTPTNPSPDNRGHLALEESLKLLNEANINNDLDSLLLRNKIIDLADGSDDYVPMEPDQIGFKPDVIGFKPEIPGFKQDYSADLDDINVPELAKYGISGIGQI
ncbi:epsilon-sarcoglycan isoform X2 [Aricia agestis]|uniref:epsilon-sarcoglycan isoform X2 n=1 Tax=Aricia agestis TaxID=91739 RepID=UPI001C2038B8|nr:epsilon-sarcoglycan isoform X2 [Aricia agestis]